ncbi:hypothetical protein [Streptomyces sp. SP18BB07]|uniref:hypothetical protein n=1 Tax=Streptomyces sp. SP18BB07 TaxID=3002522 RepID=UPI002E759E17|nr:hypothetical protein [Streptomyces sp. SP18BB07]MEE1763689.1 hypothetical protein [Streptomyces sp. SP18BB07]
MPEPTTHASPPDGSGLTPCCGRTPFELPHGDRMTPEAEHVTCTASPGSDHWALDHDVHVFAQTESRPGPLTDEGERWKECRQTSKVMVLCRCGYFSGLIDRTKLESTVATLAAEHSNDLAKAQVSEVEAPTDRPGF